VEEYIHTYMCVCVCASHVGVPLHYQVKHSIDLIPNVHLANDLVYICSSTIFKILSKRATFNQVPHLACAQLCQFKIRMGNGDYYPHFLGINKEMMSRGP
jgi:hypothetical protein